MKSKKTMVIVFGLFLNFLLFSGTMAVEQEDANSASTQKDASTSEESTASQETEETTTNDAPTTEDDPHSFLNRIPGAVKFRGVTYLKLQSAKTLSRYIPCTALEEENAKLHTRLINLKLGLGAIRPQCKEDIAYKYIPYRMTYRASR